MTEPERTDENITKIMCMNRGTGRRCEPGTCAECDKKRKDAAST